MTITQFFFAALGLAFCLGDVTAPGFLRTRRWRRATSPAARRQRLVRKKPGAAALLALLLTALAKLLLLWSQQ